jgi:hypothetical protein
MCPFSLRGSGTALEVVESAMTKYHSASLALLAILLTACGRVDSAEPRALTGETPDQAQRVPANKSAAATPATPSADPQVNPAGMAMLDFQKGIEAYLKIHNEAESKVPNLKRTDDPKEISDRERALAQTIMTLRANAQPGEIFVPDVQKYLIKIIHDDFKGRPASDRRALINELPMKMKADVNTVYPTTIPLATFPPALLRKLPDLPPELEYRIVGRSLILRDVKANLIVDVLRDVVPTIPS